MPSANLNIMIKAAQKAAVHLRRDFGEIEHIQTARKAAGEFVTQSDLKAEQIIFEILFHARPDYGFVMEEKGVIQGKDKTHIFYIDPLDGTNNFMHKNPHFATSIGLAREGQLVAGVIYNPITDDMFFAEKGQGAYLNNKRLRVSKRTKLEESLFAFSGHYHPRNLQDRQKLVEKINISAGKLSGIRHTGSSALDLAYVGAGRFDGIWGYGLKSWDIAAGLVIIQEAGGIVNAYDGYHKYQDNKQDQESNDYVREEHNVLDAKTIIATNTELQEDFLTLIKNENKNQF